MPPPFRARSVGGGWEPATGSEHPGPDGPPLLRRGELGIGNLKTIFLFPKLFYLFFHFFIDKAGISDIL